MTNCSHTHTVYIKSFRVCGSHVEAINLELLYLYVPSQVVFALGNVNLAHMDMIKERKKSERLVAESMKEQNERQEKRD